MDFTIVPLCALTYHTNCSSYPRRSPFDVSLCFPALTFATVANSRKNMETVVLDAEANIRVKKINTRELSRLGNCGTHRRKK